MTSPHILSNTVITECGALAYISADDVDEAVQRLGGTLLAHRVCGVWDVKYKGLPGDTDEDLAPYCAFAYDGRVLAN